MLYGIVHWLAEFFNEWAVRLSPEIETPPEGTHFVQFLAETDECIPAGADVYLSDDGKITTKKTDKRLEKGTSLGMSGARVIVRMDWEPTTTKGAEKCH
jgi:hypothetical protein